MKMRVLYYAATYYKLHGQIPLAKKYFMEVADARVYGMFETDLAESEIKDIDNK